MHAAEVGLPPLAGKRVLILGLARQGLALARFCPGAGAYVTMSDRAAADKLGAELAILNEMDRRGQRDTGAGRSSRSRLLDDCDLLCLSGGVPPQSPIVQEAVRRGIPLSNDSLLTFQIARRVGWGHSSASPAAAARRRRRRWWG